VTPATSQFVPSHNPNSWHSWKFTDPIASPQQATDHAWEL